MKIGASLVLLVAPTVIACAAAVPIGVGKAYNNAHATSPNNVFCKRGSSPCDRVSAIYHPHGRAPQGLANVVIGTLAPERLDLGQGRMGVGCIFHNRVEAGVLAARQQSGGEGTLRVSSPTPAPPSLSSNGRDAIFMDGDVVEVTQAILHVLERREKLLPTLRRLLAGEE